MQGFLDAPRQNFSRQNVLDALGWSPDVTVDFGMELLDSNDQPVYDISSFIDKDDASAKVSYDSTAEIPGSITLTSEYNHNWGLDRVKPFMLVSCPRLVPNGPVRFDLGVYIVTTADKQTLGEAAPQYPVVGYNKIYLLQSVIGDTYVVPAGTNYYSAISLAISAALGPGNLFNLTLESSKMDAVVPTDMVWPLASDTNQTRWIDVINDLAAAIGFRKLWCDQNGYYRSEPDILPDNRPIEFVFGAGFTPKAAALDPNFQLHGIVTDLDRTISRDSFGTPNRWTFIQNNLSFEPMAGSGLYVVNNLSNGPTSQQAINQVRQGPVQYLDASGQDDLVTQGDKVVATDIGTTETVTFKTAPLPIAGHYDILQLLDPTLPGTTYERKLVAQKWDLPLFGDDMEWTTIVTTPDPSNWNTGSSGTVGGQNLGGGGLLPAYDPIQAPIGTKYKPITPVIIGIPPQVLQ